MVNILYRALGSLVVVLAAWLIKKHLTDSMVEAFTKKHGVEASTSKPIKNFFGVIVSLIAFFVLLGVWNLRTTLTGLLAAAGIGGIVIGLSLREVLSDVLAGVIFFFDRPFKVGDSLVVGDIGGAVLDIGVRSVKLKTWDGVFATIPNRKVASGVLEDLPYHGGVHRRVRSTGQDFTCCCDIWFREKSS